jgi:hypothetical protein
MNTAQPLRQEIATPHEAEALIARIGDAMVALVKICEEETRLVKAGRLADASALTPEKTRLASEYLREVERFKTNGPFIGKAAPGHLEELRKAHAAFRDIVAVNLRVVATAQSVAEGVVRGAAEQAAARAAPKGYGADGTAAATRTSRPVVISRAS